MKIQVWCQYSIRNVWKVTQKVHVIKKTQTNKISLENASSSTMEDDSRIRAGRAAKVFDVCKAETQ